MTAAAAMEPTELEELMEAQAEARTSAKLGMRLTPRRRTLPPRRRASMLRALTCFTATIMRSRT